jgi:hypothetical protein
VKKQEKRKGKVILIFFLQDIQHNKDMPLSRGFLSSNINSLSNISNLTMGNILFPLKKKNKKKKKKNFSLLLTIFMTGLRLLSSLRLS